jgi:uncharacterized protein (DUF1330 family)
LKILVHIQIPEDGRELFDAYEEQVLPLLAKHGGKVIERHLSKLGDEEFHLIEFDSENGLNSYESDPHRIAAQPLWEQSDATARIIKLA